MELEVQHDIILPKSCGIQILHKTKVYSRKSIIEVIRITQEIRSGHSKLGSCDISIYIINTN